MKFFVDTAEIDAIAELNDLGMVDGVTNLVAISLTSRKKFAPWSVARSVQKSPQRMRIQ